MRNPSRVPEEFKVSFPLQHTIHGCAAEYVGLVLCQGTSMLASADSLQGNRQHWELCRAYAIRRMRPECAMLLLYATLVGHPEHVSLRYMPASLA